MVKCSYTGVWHTRDENEAEASGMIKFPYRFLHIPSAIPGSDCVYCKGAQDFKELLAVWNRLGNMTWKYWEE